MKTARKDDSHKGENGRLLVICGSKDFPGAAYLASAASIASLRTGTDIVTVAAPEKVAWSINSINPDIITVKLKGDFLGTANKSELLREIERHDVILLGPGVSDKGDTQELVEDLITLKKPKVLDADALKMVDLNRLNNSILTPHMGELVKILENSQLIFKPGSDDFDELKKYVGSNVIVLKGKKDLIITRNTIIENETGNPGMTVGGTGDVLSGVCAGLLTQGFEPVDAAYYGAKIIGKIGDGLKEKYGYGFIASDFLSLIAENVKDELG